MELKQKRHYDPEGPPLYFVRIYTSTIFGGGSNLERCGLYQFNHELGDLKSLFSGRKLTSTLEEIQRRKGVKDILVTPVEIHKREPAAVMDEQRPGKTECTLLENMSLAINPPEPASVVVETDRTSFFHGDLG